MEIWHHNCFLVQIQIIYCTGNTFCACLSITNKEQSQYLTAASRNITPWCDIGAHPSCPAAQICASITLFWKKKDFPYHLQKSLWINSTSLQVHTTSVPGKAQTVPGLLATKNWENTLANAHSLPWYLRPVPQESALGCFQRQSAVWPSPAIVMFCKWHHLLKKRKIKRNQCFWSQALATGKLRTIS